MMASFACITEIHVVHIFHGGYLDYRGAFSGQSESLFWA